MAQTSNRRTTQGRKGNRSGGGRRAGGHRSRRQRGGKLVFDRKNYLLLIAGVCVVIFGYVMMRVENEVDGFISLYVAPLLILGGYLEIIYAIMWRPREDKETGQPEPAA